MFLVKENGLLHKCNSSAATYLFQQDKFYDVSYDTGDKSIQCGRKVDVFKFWLMLKARGLSGLERLVDNALEKAEYFTNQIRLRDRFTLLQQNELHRVNVSFWYIPKKMGNQSKTEEWWQELNKVAPAIKEKMIKDNSRIMVGYAPLPSKNIGNFFRMTFSCFPPMSESVINALLDDIEMLGENI